LGEAPSTVETSTTVPPPTPPHPTPTADVYPLIAAIGAVCTIGLYASVRQMSGNPEVHFSRGARGAAPWERPETDEQAEAWAKRIVKNQRHIDSECCVGVSGRGVGVGLP
jgi:hypothetical protein